MWLLPLTSVHVGSGCKTHVYPVHSGVALTTIVCVLCLVEPSVFTCRTTSAGTKEDVAFNNQLPNIKSVFLLAHPYLFPPIPLFIGEQGKSFSFLYGYVFPGTVACGPHFLISSPHPSLFQSMLFVEIPEYRNKHIRTPVKVNFYVINGKRKRSQPQHFTFHPGNSQERTNWKEFLPRRFLHFVTSCFIN